MQLYHDSHSLFYRDPFGALRCGDKVTIRVRAIGATKVYLRFYNGSEFFLPMINTERNVYEYTLTMPEVPILCWYDFKAVNDEGDVLCYGNNDDMLGGSGQMTMFPRGYQITVYDPAYDTPRFMRHGVMYQIFPDRFYRDRAPVTDRDDIYLHRDWHETPAVIPGKKEPNPNGIDFFGGTLNGIAEKLPYLQSLGITVLYLNPIFKAHSNHRYDTGDYSQVDPLLGTNHDLKVLCEKAQALGMSVMLDGVFSHTGDDSLYFNRYGNYPTVGAYQSKESKYYDWYSFEKYPDKYNSWWGFTTLPAVNKDNRRYQSFMFNKDGIVRKWIRMGTDGWRLDVADELPMDFLRKLRKAVKAENEQAVVLGEVWEDASHKVAYGEMRCYCQGDTLDSVMNYPLRDALIRFLTFKLSAFGLARIITSQKENYPAPFYYSLMNLCGSHDRARAVNYLAECTFEDVPFKDRPGKRLTKEKYALGEGRFAMMMQMMSVLPGIPCLYYGDEIGMQGAPDPFCRGTFDWENQNTQMLSFIRDILTRRSASQVLQTGFVKVEALDEDIITITRYNRHDADAFGVPAADETFEMTFDRRDLPDLSGGYEG